MNKKVQLKESVDLSETVHTCYVLTGLVILSFYKTLGIPSASVNLVKVPKHV